MIARSENSVQLMVSLPFGVLFHEIGSNEPIVSNR